MSGTETKLILQILRELCKRSDVLSSKVVDLERVNQDLRIEITKLVEKKNPDKILRGEREIAHAIGYSTSWFKIEKNKQLLFPYGLKRVRGRWEMLLSNAMAFKQQKSIEHVRKHPFDHFTE